MPDMILDGTGSGSRARVNRGNALITAATIQSEEHLISSAEGLTFFATTMDTADTLTVTAAGGNMLFLSNTHLDRQLVIATVWLSTDTPGMQVKLLRNVTVGAVGNNNVTVPLSANFNNSSAPLGTFYNWNEAGDGITGLSGGDSFLPFVLAAGVTQVLVEGSVILEKNNNIVIHAKNAGELAIGVRFFYMEQEVV